MIQAAKRDQNTNADEDTRSNEEILANIYALRAQKLAYAQA